MGIAFLGPNSPWHPSSPGVPSPVWEVLLSHQVTAACVAGWPERSADLAGGWLLASRSPAVRACLDTATAMHAPPDHTPSAAADATITGSKLFTPVWQRLHVMAAQ